MPQNNHFSESLHQKSNADSFNDRIGPSTHPEVSNKPLKCARKLRTQTHATSARSAETIFVTDHFVSKVELLTEFHPPGSHYPNATKSPFFQNYPLFENVIVYFSSNMCGDINSTSADILALQNNI